MYQNTNWTDEGFGLIESLFAVFFGLFIIAAQLFLLVFAVTFDVCVALYGFYQDNYGSERN